MTRQQKWAKHALNRVSEHKKKTTEEKYRTLCMKAPSLLRQAGLVQAIAFLQTRNTAGLEEGPTFVKDLAVGLGYADAKALQDKAHEASLPDYMLLTSDAIALSAWFRRFAQAELAGEG